MKNLLIGLLAILSLFSSLAFSAPEKLLIQSNLPARHSLFPYQKEFLDNIAKQSNGEISFNLQPLGGIVDGPETLDAIRLGILDGQLTATGYFGSKDPALNLIGDVTGAWNNSDEFLRFMYEAGGNQLMSNIYKKYGIHYIGAYTYGPESLVSKKPINSIDDLKGLKVRTASPLESSVFKAAGAIPLRLSANQVEQALKEGVIDASDYDIFSVNQAVGINNIAPNPVYPGFHSEPLLEFSISENKWQKLPKNIQTIMESSIREFAYKTAKKLENEDREAIKEANQNPKIKIHDLSPEERIKFRRIAEKEWEKIAEQSASAKQVYDTLINFLQKD